MVKTIEVEAGWFDISKAASYVGCTHNASPEKFPWCVLITNIKKIFRN